MEITLICDPIDTGPLWLASCQIMLPNGLATVRVRADTRDAAREALRLRVYNVRSAPDLTYTEIVNW